MKIVIAAAFIGLALAGCDPVVPDVQTRIVEIPSSKPYRFIHWSMDVPPEIRAEIRRHNRAHQAVINAENEAKDKM